MGSQHVFLAAAAAACAAQAAAHVPVYCSEGCCEPSHPHTTSQAVYIRGTGGLDVKIKSETNPFAIAAGEQIDFDVVMRDRYDPTTYKLHVGCGECGKTGPVLSGGQYKDPVLEPFTQTGYHGLFRNTDRPKYNAAALAGCTQSFTVWIEDYRNRTDKDPLFWSAVIGRGEAFTGEELFLFPLYIQRNHGYNWSQQGWTLPVVAVVCIGLAVFVIRLRPRHCVNILDAYDNNWSTADKFRAHMYTLAILAYSISAVDAIVHLSYVQHKDTPYGGSYIGAVVMVLMISHGFPLLITVLTFKYLYDKGTSFWARWFPFGFIELAVGISWFFFFGSGLWVAPTAVTAAALARLWSGITEYTREGRAMSRNKRFRTLNSGYAGP